MLEPVFGFGRSQLGPSELILAFCFGLLEAILAAYLSFGNHCCSLKNYCVFDLETIFHGPLGGLFGLLETILAFLWLFSTVGSQDNLGIWKF